MNMLENVMCMIDVEFGAREGQALPRPTYFVVDFWGKPLAHEKYQKLKTLCEMACQALVQDGRSDDSLSVRLWMMGVNGFTRPHTPYFVRIPKSVWKLVSEMLRTSTVFESVSFTDNPYKWVLHYGMWEY